jgi:hypothetical protein
MIWPLSTRETAVAVWTAGIVAWSLRYRGFREAAAGLLKSLLHPALAVPLGLLVGYCAGVAYALSRIGYWAPSQLKDTVIWLAFSLTALGFSAISGSKERGFWKRLLFDQLRIMVVVEWVVNEYTMPLAGELVLFPFLLLLGGMIAVGERKPEYQKINAHLSNALIAVGSALVAFSAYRALTELRTQNLGDALRSISLSPVLTVCALPAVFALGLWSTYEDLFIQVGAWRPGQGRFGRYAALRILTYCSFRPVRVAEFVKKYRYDVFNLRTKQELTALLERARRGDPSILHALE